MKKVVVVSAAWCSQCQPYKKALEQNGIKFESLDADAEENMDFIASIGVRGLPTTLLYDGEILVDKLPGNKLAQVKEFLSE